MKVNVQKTSQIAFVTFGALVLLAVVYGLYRAAFPAPEPVQGMVFAKTVDVASKVTGRVETIFVTEGDDVKKDAVLLKLDIPEVSAKLRQVQAKESAARAKMELVDEGARKEEIAAAFAQLSQAKSAEKLANDTLKRMTGLFKDGLISRQQFDEVKTKAQVAHESRVMASQRYEALVTGARVQEKAAAKALLEEAKSGVEQVDSLVKESLVTATLDAEVSRVHVEEGELGAAGFPLVTLVDLNDVWVVFNVKEDLLNRFAKGAVLKGIVPAISPRPFDFKVYFINPRGDYATHRATRQSSGYDLKTFEVRAKPVNKIVGLRPGMSVIVE